MNIDNRGKRSAPSEWHRMFVFLWLAAGLLCLLPRQASAQVTHGPSRIRNVYIPADQLKLLFKSSSKGVLMPRDEILDLWEKAQRRVPSETVPPVDAVLSSAAYEAKLDDHELRVSGRIQIAKLREGRQAIDLPFGGLAIESAQLDDQPARFGRKADGTLFLVLEKQGRFELVLEMSAPLASKDGDLATTLKLPRCPLRKYCFDLTRASNCNLARQRCKQRIPRALCRYFALPSIARAWYRWLYRIVSRAGTGRLWSWSTVTRSCKLNRPDFAGKPCSI